jgi:hypothetical protein
MEVRTTEGRLDRHFPDAGGAEKDFVVRLLERSAGLVAQLRGLDQRPKQDMGVEKNPHSAPFKGLEHGVRKRSVEIRGHARLAGQGA